MLIPDAQVFAVAPCLQEGAGAVHPMLPRAGMGIGIFAEAAHSTFFECLAVHIFKQLPCLFLLSVFYHALHGYAVVPQPDGAVVVGVVFVVVVPIFVLRVELRVGLRQRCHSPRIHQFFPAAAGDFLLECLVGNQFKAK